MCYISCVGVEIIDNLVVPAPPEVSVLVVGYKSLGYIERCLRGAITSAQGHHFEFLFIDCSDDGSEALVRKQFPQVRVLPYQGNLGFGRGNNVLAAVAYGKRMLLLNPDVFARRDELSALLSLSHLHADAVAWGAITVSPQGRIDGSSIPPMLGAVSLSLMLIGLARYRPGAIHPSHLRPQYAQVLSGAFMMVDAHVWRSLGGFDERFFMYAEEVDLCKRIADAGGTLVIDPRIQMLHDSGSGVQRTPSRMLNRARGDATFYNKHYGPLHSVLCKTLLWLYAASRELYGRVSGRADYAASFGAVVRQPSVWWSGW